MLCGLQRGGGAPRTPTVRVQVAIDFMDAIKGGKREIRLGGFKGVPGGKTVEVDIPAGMKAQSYVSHIPIYAPIIGPTLNISQLSSNPAPYTCDQS